MPDSFLTGRAHSVLTGTVLNNVSHRHDSMFIPKSIADMTLPHVQRLSIGIVHM